ncbi:MULTISPECIES: hypothetical protein [unclassified Knoellia]|uniref:hypothetical protein n=1 Tax=Knoellia altitudinis TaxID=3404795 RepID=UPI003612EA8F
MYPQWYLRFLDEVGPPPLGWSSNGEPVRNREGKQIHGKARQRVLLPACEPCNNELDRRFEKPAKDAIKRLVATHWSGIESQATWQAVGLWWAKVLLLLGHPLARHEHPRLDEVAVRYESEPPDYRWMVDGSPVPEGLSLWVFNGTIEEVSPAYSVPVPRWVREPDGVTTDFHFMMLGTEGLCVTLISHPGWAIEHPLVVRNEAWELLHAPPESGDLSTMPRLGSKAVGWPTFAGALKDGYRLGGDLPPLGTTEHWPASPEVLSVMASTYL